jgi:hypothetical protein
MAAPAAVTDDPKADFSTGLCYWVNREIEFAQR